METDQSLPRYPEVLTPERVLQALGNRDNRSGRSGIVGQRRNTETWVTGNNPPGWWSNWAHKRHRVKKTVLAILTGGLGDGKSISGLEIAKHFDPKFGIENVVFYGFDFMRAVRFVAARADFWGQPWVEFDEPNIADLSQLEFNRVVGRTVTKFTQASRKYGVNGLLCLPATRLMNSGVIEVAQCRIRILGEGKNFRYGRVDEIKPNEYSNSPRFFFPRMGYLKIMRADKDFIAAYEAKREKFLEGFFSDEKIDAMEKEQNKPKKQEASDYAKFVIEHLEDPTIFPDGRGFKNEKGELSYSKIQAGPKGEWDLSTGTASRVKNQVTAKLPSETEQK